MQSGMTMASSEKRQQHPTAKVHSELDALGASSNTPFLTPSPSARSGGGDGGNNPNPAPASKRRRINFACDYCRSRKTRCDEGQPACCACLNAGIECVTRNRRQPWVSDVRRHEAGRQPDRRRTRVMPRQQRQDDSLSVQVQETADESLVVGESRGGGDHSRSASSLRRTRQQSHQENGPGALEASNVENAGLRRSRVLFDTPYSPSGQPRDNPDSRNESQTHRTRTSQHPEAAPIDEDRPELNTRLPIIQIDSGNTPLELMASWLDLARYRLRIPRSGSQVPAPPTRDPSDLNSDSRFNSSLPRSVGACNIPDLDVLLPLVNSFLEGPNVLFPLLHPDRVKHAARMASRQGPNALAQEHGLPTLMQIYLVMILGHASQPCQDPEIDIEGYLGYSESLLGLILQQGSIEALQAVMLLSMALRCHDKLSAAAHTMSLAVSMGVALGLPRYLPRLPTGEERRATWMCVFAFEKILSFELGRPSLIPDDYPEPLPDSLLAERSVEGAVGDERTGKRETPPAFEVVLSLAKLLSEVGRWCVSVSRKEDDKSDDSITEVVKEKVKTTGLSCVKLLEWASDVCPSHYRPNSDILFDSKLHPFTSFIAMQYHMALIFVTRNSLLISEKAIRLAVDVIAKNEPWEFAVRNGQSLAVNAARKILRLYLESSEHGILPALPSLAGPLNAMSILAVFVATRPDSRMASMDRELLKATALTVKDGHTTRGVERELDFVFRKLDTLVGAVTVPRDYNRGRNTQRSRAQSPVPLSLPREQTSATGEQATSSSGINQGRVHHQLCDGGDVAQGGCPPEHMYSLDDGANLTYSEWWPEDSSPMIMDEFGWNWANFSQLLEGSHGDELQSQL